MNEIRPDSDTAQWKLPPPMTGDEFNAIGGFIQSRFGIKMPPVKMVMLQSRLTKRLRAMNMSSYGEYREYLFSPEGLDREVPFMIDVVTTNKTDFFREPSHFEMLRNELLPRWLRRNGGGEAFRIWSAGCASGEEPYTMAMILNEFAAAEPSFRFSVLGTDISGEALDKAVRAVYPDTKTTDIPPDLKKKYLLRGREGRRGLVRIVPELRARVTFERLNLMCDASFADRKMDVIFCRNVIIYFERPVQERLFRNCCRCLETGGHLFIGHSETLSGMRLPLVQVRPTIYQKIKSRL